MTISEEIIEPVMWLSFADADRPKGQQFLGVAIVPASDIVSAAVVAHLMGINPGGEVRGQGPFPAADFRAGNWIGRLLDRNQANALNDELATIAEGRADV